MSVIGVGDTPFAWQDVWVGLAVVAQATEHALIGPMVTTPFLRHPAITARAVSSLQELSGGRAILGFGSGGSVPMGLGRGPATMKETREYLLALRALFEGESITWDGLRVAPLRLVNRVPIYLSAYGPKAQRLAAELADGVIVETSMDTTRLAEHVAHVRETAREFGREEEVELWARTWWAVRGTRDAAIEDIAAHLTTAAAFRMRPARAFARVPDHLKERVRQFQRDYDVSQHVVVGGPNTALLDDAELTEFLAGDTSIAGTPDEVAAAIRDVASHGVTCLLSSLPGNADPEGTMRRFAQAHAAAGV